MKNMTSNRRPKSNSPIGQSITAMLFRQLTVAAVFFIAASLLHGSENFKVKACADALGRAIRNDAFTEEGVNAAATKLRELIPAELAPNRDSDSPTQDNSDAPVTSEITFQ